MAKEEMPPATEIGIIDVSAASELSTLKNRQEKNTSQGHH